VPYHLCLRFTRPLGKIILRTVEPLRDTDRAVFKIVLKTISTKINELQFIVIQAASKSFVFCRVH